ncbi:phosphoesterase [Pilimelia terevasa]|uniref:Phosphoesterase n=1 Tax=Pilimelia terevasa TaxID=53372 RepID=A0A8J3BQ67_9ACTN|nr:2'-5' RNA ligase family protein [Pilimelia terevasa]GGK30766.1 phosphoesterase [Pilimelia terevasa]
MAVRVGVLVDVPPPWRDVLHRHRVAAGDALAAEVPPHLTLLPPARLPAEALDALDAHLAGVAARTAPFTLRLAGTGTFRPVTDVVYVRVADGDRHARALAGAVAAFAALEPESAYPYHPHVTVAHQVPPAALDAAAAALAAFAAAFPVTGFALYVQDAGGAWRPRRDYGLAG